MEYLPRHVSSMGNRRRSMPHFSTPNLCRQLNTMEYYRHLPPPPDLYPPPLPDLYLPPLPDMYPPPPPPPNTMAYPRPNVHRQPNTMENRPVPLDAVKHKQPLPPPPPSLAARYPNLGDAWKGEPGPGVIFLEKYWFEDRDHVDDAEFYSPGEEICPNTHQLVKRFLKQVRESKGYDVDCYPPPMFVSPFMPINLDEVRRDKPGFYERRVLAPACDAIQEINAWTGRNYVLVEIEKAVGTTVQYVYLTFTAKDFMAGPSAPVETFQAMVTVPFGRGKPRNVVEWRHKPITSGA